MLLISSFLTTNLKPNAKVANYLGKLAVTIVEQGKRSQTVVNRDRSLQSDAYQPVHVSAKKCVRLKVDGLSTVVLQ